MQRTKKRLGWLISYSLFCLVYVGLMLVWGRTEFRMVNGQYREARQRTSPLLIEKLARKECQEECRENVSSVRLRQRLAKDQDRNTLAGSGAAGRRVGDAPCLDPSPERFSAKIEQLTSRLNDEQSRAAKKFILFYLSFALFFLILPLAAVYWIGVLAAWLYAHLRFVR